MNWDDIDWDNFSCVDMTRRIKDKIDMEIANMAPNEVCEYLRNSHIEFEETTAQ